MYVCSEYGNKTRTQMQTRKMWIFHCEKYKVLAVICALCEYGYGYGACVQMWTRKIKLKYKHEDSESVHRFLFWCDHCEQSEQFSFIAAYRFKEKTTYI